MLPLASTWIPSMDRSGAERPGPRDFLPPHMWMFGCTKPTREVTAVAQTPPCRYHLGLGIYNVQTAVEGMDGNKRSHFLHLCGQLLRLVLIPCHVEGEPHPWIRTTALSFAAELDGHVSTKGTESDAPQPARSIIERSSSG